MNNSDRIELAVIEHVRRYGFGVPRFCVSALKDRFPTLGKTQVAKLLKQMHIEKGTLRTETLWSCRRVYVLNEPDAPRRMVSERDAVNAWAILELCFGDPNSVRKKLTETELADLLPDASHDRRGSGNFYLHEGRLGYLRVDLGGKGRWDRIISYCSRDLARFETRPGIAQLMPTGLFEMTIATCTAQKARRIRQEIARKPLHRVVAIDVVAFPDLLNLVAPPPLKFTSYSP